MKRILLATAFLCAITVSAEAQDDKGTKATRTKEPQATKTGAVPVEKVNADGGIAAPVPASMATPEQLKKMETDSQAPKAVEQKQPENKAAAPKTESK